MDGGVLVDRDHPNWIAAQDEFHTPAAERDRVMDLLRDRIRVPNCDRIFYIRAALTCDGLYAEINQDNSLFITWDPAFLKQMSAREQSSQAVAPRSDLKEQMIAQRLPLPPLAPHAQKYSKISLPF